LNFLSRPILTRKYQIPNWHTTGIEAHYEWRNRAWRHEGASTICVGNRLRCSCGHIRAGMERKLQQANILDRLRLNRLNACDVKKVVLVVVDEVAFHLRRVHSSIGSTFAPR
jgi:hypothetical protein